ncbi:glycosyltransferase family 4 protein [Methanolobus halotolerans]|uniref:Glycosyl transferase n=1 Tax=Methanolobus halotolerans TaxID=2052935 RepID=A0A4E0QSD1_9EURY|nr:glycosyltransferase family 4 protein [Methanolobus halotolerans]TGC09818.1 glycosyl transferase [Methanolobus halotolerans]
MKRKLKVLFIGTYVPRECGIATFTSDLFNTISKEDEVDCCEVIALNDIDETYDYPEEVVFEIRRNKLEDYYRAADHINRSDHDVVCLQHEFGLYWGDAGDYIFALLSSIDKPIITTLHTVIKDPEPPYRRVTEKLMQYSDKVIVMSETSENILHEVYDIHNGKTELVYHGIPDCPFTDSKEHKELLGLKGSPLILTFGLLNPNKGVETTLDALPAVVEKHPGLKYLVLGATHPEIKRNFGEAYREYLLDKVHELGLESNVIFHDKFVEKNELYEYILASDIYVSPYHSREQVVSGALTYAIGMGKAIVSTPYWYAQETLTENRGILVEFEDITGISKALMHLIENPQECNEMRRNAYEFGRQMIWKNVGKEYISIFRLALKNYPVSTTDEKTDFSLFSVNLPKTKLDYMISMTDDVGIFQHATFGVPSRRHGYSTDDVGRGLVALTRAMSGNDRIRDIKKLVTLYLSYLDHAQTEKGHFHNFMSYDRKFLDDKGSDDTFGRALYGLGHVCACSLLPDNLRSHALGMIRRSRPVMDEIHAPRAKAYTMSGLYEILDKGIDKDIFLPVFIRYADHLTGLYEDNRQDDWEWFEPEVTYGNAKMCEVLMLAYNLTGNPKYRDTGIKTLDFLTELQWNGEFFDLVGNEGWCKYKCEKALFGQQPIDAAYLTEAYVTAYELTRRERYFQLANRSIEYFLGRNRLNAVMYDHESGAVCDGLDMKGMNPNQGAESVVCFIMALEMLTRYSEKTEGSKQQETGKELMQIYGKNKFSTKSLS